MRSARTIRANEQISAGWKRQHDAHVATWTDGLMAEARAAALVASNALAGTVPPAGEATARAWDERAADWARRSGPEAARRRVMAERNARIARGSGERP